MIVRGLFLADGPSDLPLAGLLERLCHDLGAQVRIAAIDPRLVHDRIRSVDRRAQFVVSHRLDFDLLFVHRDAENQPPSQREQEIAEAVRRAGIEKPVVPVVPVRMTEAWLLLDEMAIRQVAGRPSDRSDLALPDVRRVESISDPKQALRTALLRASGTTGRRRAQFERDFGRHRALLLERLETTGAVSSLAAWSDLRHCAQLALRQLRAID